MSHPEPRSVSPRPAVVCLVADPILSTQMEDAIRAAGGASVLLDHAAGLADTVDRRYPVLVLVDLTVEGDWGLEIRRVKLRPATRQTPIVAFGGRGDGEPLRRARTAGADHVWLRSRMVGELVGLVQNHVSPPVRYPPGWDDRLPEKALRGLEEFNRGSYFEQHEFFEDAWNDEPRPIRDMYQGILQVGVAFMQVEAGNRAGALKLFRRGLPRLRDLPPVCQGIDIAAFRAAAEAIHARVTALDGESLGEIAPSTFPQLAYDAQWQPPASSR